MTVYVATESFSCDLDGVPVNVTKGITRVREGHPLLRGREQLFTVDDQIDFDLVEAATAAPGEKRGRPRRTAAGE
jgi:hypothetical protein